MTTINKKKLLAMLSPLSVMGGLSMAQADENQVSRGALDVFVDHSYLDDTIKNALANGIEVKREDTQTLIGDGEKTKQNIAKVKEYYLAKQKELIEAIDKYKKAKGDIIEYNNQKDNANGIMNAYISNLTTLGMNVIAEGVEYSKSAFEENRKLVEDAIKTGKLYRDIKSEITNYESLKNSYVLFSSQNAAGNIKLSHKTVKVKSAQEVNTIKDELTKKYAELEKYVNSLASKTGSIPDSEKPTFELVDIQVDNEIQDKALAPVKVNTYLAKDVKDIVKPTVSYHFYDIKSTPNSNGTIENADDEVIDVQAKDNSTYVQALKNQIINLKVKNENLPEGRFDKIHNIMSTITLPDGVEVDENDFKSNDFWDVSYNKETNKVIYKATAKYLVEVNNNQNINNGVIGGYMKDEFAYSLPSVKFKLKEDNKEYKLEFETIVNNEYLVSNKSVTIKTNAAEPEKHNKNDKGVLIDGKAVLPGTVNNFELTSDYSKYKGVKIDKQMQEKGLSVYDVAPFDAVDFKGPIQIKDGDNVIATSQEDGTFKDNEGNTVEGVTWSIRDGIEGTDIKGKVVAVDIKGVNHKYYTEYVQKGKQLKFVIPMTTKVVKNDGSYNGNSYSNTFYQSDFGNTYQSNKVENNVPKIEPRKDIVKSRSNLQSLDLKSNEKATIEQDTTFQYRATGTAFPKNMDITSYKITDTFDEADEYNGTYFVETGKEIQFKKGTALYERYKKTGGKMPAHTDITKYTTQEINRSNDRITKVDLTFDNDFIESIDFENSEFHVDTFFEAKRSMNKQAVKNVFKEIINGLEFDSTEVTSNTSENIRDSFEKRLKEITDRITKDKENQTKKDKEQDEQIANNTLSIRKLVQRVDKVEEVQQTHSDSIKGLLEQLNKKPSVVHSKVTIYKDSVTSEAEAIDYVTNRGIAPSEITKVELDKDNHFVVTYRNDKPITEIAVNKEKVSKVRSKYEFYTLKSKEEVIAKLKELKVDTKDVSIEQEGTKFIAIVTLRK